MNDDKPKQTEEHEQSFTYQDITEVTQEWPEDKIPPYRSDFDRGFKRLLIFLILVMAAGSFGYRFLHSTGLEQSAALFIGLPALIAIAVLMLPKARSATGSILKAITVALCLAGPLLGEGILCILISAPLFYLVGIIIGLVEDRRRRRLDEPHANRLRAVVLLPIAIMSLEGVTDELSFQRKEAITVTRIVNGTVEECEQQLAQKPTFPRPLPGFLAAGWPRPAETSGGGLVPGSLRTVRFVGSEGKPGTLTMKVAEYRPGFIRFQAVSDTSHMPHWLDWDESVVALKPAGSNQTQVTWTTKYIRRLDPAWYFAPWQRYAVKLATGYLIDNLATPRS